jgi:hypothetical protein
MFKNYELFRKKVSLSKFLHVKENFYQLITIDLDKNNKFTYKSY